LREKLTHVQSALEYGAHAIVGKSRVEAMLPSAAGRDWIGRIAPLIISMCERSKLSRTRGGPQGQEGNECAQQQTI
jgi:hypothetical protein